MATLVTGDIHLVARPAEEYRWRVFSFLAKQAEKRNAENLVLLGDVTDRKDNHPSRLVNRLVQELSKLPFERIYWLVGNHDYADPTVPFFQFLNRMPRLVFISTPTVLEVDGLTSLFLPNSRDPLNDWKDIHFEGSDQTFMHQPSAGAAMSNGTKMGDDDPSTKGLIPFLRSKPTGPIRSGDIHVPQQCGPITYLGSPHPVHFGDSFEPRIGCINGAGFESIPRRSIRRMSVTITDPNELLQMDLRAGDHIKVQVALPRSAYGTFDAAKRKVAELAAQQGVELHGCQLRPAEQISPASGPTTPLRSPKGTRRPDKQIARFLAYKEEPDAGLLAVIGEELFKKGNPTATEARKAGDLVFCSITIAGFKSFTSKVSLRFDNKAPGLWSLYGRNEVEPKLGANGVGKSSLWDALCWCLWGKTSREVFGPSLLNWAGAEKCRVAVRLKKGDAEFIVVRTQKPNSLQLLEGDAEPLTLTQGELSDRLGLSLDEFLLSGLMSQFGRYFLDLSNTDRLDVFSGARGLQAWENASEAASQAWKDLETRKTEATQATAHARGRVEACKETIARTQDRVAKATSALQAARNNGEAKPLEAEQAQLNRSLADLRQEEHTLRSQARELDIEIEALEKEDNRYSVRVWEPAQAELASRKAEAKSAREAKDKIISAGTCPSCKQDVPATHVARLQRQAEQKAETALEALSAALRKAEAIDAERTKARATLDEKRVLRRERRPLQDKNSSAVRKIEESLSDICRRLDKLAEAENLADQEVKSARKEHAAAELALSAAAQRVLECEGEETLVSMAAGPIDYWRKGFRDLRFWLISEALEEFEIGANNALEQLGLVGWKITFDVERMTGAGTVSQGFHVFIKSPASPDRVPWESWSGGESQRLKLAVADSLSTLIGSWSGVGVNIQVFDEPTSHLSEEGVQDVLTYLADRARMERRLVWIVDHHPASHGAFQGEYLVIKDAAGSRLERVRESMGE